MQGVVGEDCRRLVLTAHPLQRVGAFALAALVPGRRRRLLDPTGVHADEFDAVVARLTEDAAAAALVDGTKADDGFWLKASGSLFPNSPINHPSRLKKSAEERAAEVRRWRSMPDRVDWPDVACVLCGRPACGFYGKVDVPLAESTLYRNTTPLGHAGMSLCWACLCCFYALPYGARLTGGPSSVLHSWDEDFLAAWVSGQAARTGRALAIGVPPEGGAMPAEVLALKGLRGYGHRMTDGVELIVFSNNNRGQEIDSYPMTQPMAEWLRTTLRSDRHRGFDMLLRAFRTEKAAGHRRLAWAAFHRPEDLLRRGVAYACSSEWPAGISGSLADLAAICRSLATEVFSVNERDVAEIQTVAAHVATVIARSDRGGQVTGFRVAATRPAQLQALLQSMATRWLLNPDNTASTDPFVTMRQFRLLFDPDRSSWLHRQLLVVGVLEELHRVGWLPDDGEAAEADADSDIAEDLARMTEEIGQIDDDAAVDTDTGTDTGTENTEDEERVR